MKGKLITLWDGEIEISTPAELNTETGEITTESIDANGLETLDREYFQSDEFFNSGEEFEVCPDCHEYILKTVMMEGIGKTLFEANVCSNPDCVNS
jgi:hypothetical protein